MSDPLPEVRHDIQFIPAQSHGRQVIAVRDQLGLSEGMVLLAPEALAILPLFDGQHTRRDMQHMLTRAGGGQLVTMEDVERIIAELDDLLLLQSERYLGLKAGIEAEWTGREVRPASNAGNAYPADPAELQAFLDEILQRAENAEPPQQRPRALVAPHIDLRVGQAVYAHAYAPARNLEPKRVIVLGTGHMLEHPFSVSTKRYQTPLGTSPNDPEAAERLIAAGGEHAASDFVHRDEHSIEFQVLFVQHLFGTEVPVVPVLFGSLGEHLDRVERPADIPAVAEFAKALQELADDHTLVVAGVDFSHVGPKFGHDHPATTYELKFRAHDQNLLEAIENGSAETLWAESKRVQDRWHVCGLPVLACLLTALPDLKGEVQKYDVWYEAPTHSAVSFAAVLLS